jgi:predicted nucleic acid-binding protein
MIVVLDASAAVRVVTRQPEADRLATWLSAASRVVVPDLFASEVSSALWKLARFAGLPSQVAGDALSAALALPDEVLGGADLAPEVLQLALQRQRAVYDLYYLIAARRLGANLLTTDKGLATFAREIGVAVIE